jgi:hypothetical protein
MEHVILSSTQFKMFLPSSRFFFLGIFFLSADPASAGREGFPCHTQWAQ